MINIVNMNKKLVKNYIRAIKTEKKGKKIIIRDVIIFIEYVLSIKEVQIDLIQIVVVAVI